MIAEVTAAASDGTFGSAVVTYSSAASALNTATVEGVSAIEVEEDNENDGTTTTVTVTVTHSFSGFACSEVSALPLSGELRGCES